MTAQLLAGGQRSLFEAEALAATDRALNASNALGLALEAAASALRRGDLPGEKDLAKVTELLRLGTARLAVFGRRLAEGTLEDRSAEVTP